MIGFRKLIEIIMLRGRLVEMDLGDRIFSRRYPLVSKCGSVKVIRSCEHPWPRADQTILNVIQ